MNWTDERVELLKKLWAEGFSASQIAVKLGGVTRNAVIGKAHRLKLSGRAKTQPRIRKTNAVATAAEQGDRHVETVDANIIGEGGGGKSGRRIVERVSIVGATALKLEYAEDALAGQEPRLRSQENVILPMARKLTLMQLTEHTCKWPVGDPLNEDFYFCGADSGDSGPYCSCHAKLAFNTGDKRRH